MDSQGINMNLYDPGVVKKMVNVKRMAVVYHVDALNISYMDRKEVTRIIKIIKSVSGEDIQVLRRNNHKYLGIDLNLSAPSKVRVTMVDYLNKVIAYLP